jgi:hypothetical protein
LALTQEQLWHVVGLWEDGQTVFTIDKILNTLRAHGTNPNTAAEMLRDALNEGYLYVDRIQQVAFGYWVWIGLTPTGENVRQSRLG